MHHDATVLPACCYQVAKESRFVDSGDAGSQDRIRFHETFAKTQNQAQLFAQAFNAKVKTLLRIRGVPLINFLEVSVYLFKPFGSGEEVGYLVEKQLTGQWKKWNNNAGYVAGKRDDDSQELEDEDDTTATFPAWDVSAPLRAVEEAEECSWSDEDDDMETVSATDDGKDTQGVLQTFSHFTFCETNGKAIVVDLQGAYNSSCTPPQFELTDPAIHSRSHSHRNGKTFGATDKGEFGIHTFQFASRAPK